MNSGKINAPDQMDSTRSEVQVRGSQQNAGQDELVVILVTATFCPAARREDFREALPDLDRILRARAEAQELRLRRVGLSLDWDPVEGIQYLSGLWDFDELIAGGNWLNEGTLKYVWDVFPGNPAVPQLILLRRRLSVGEKGKYRLDGEELQTRVIGVNEILRWIEVRTVTHTGP